MPELQRPPKDRKIVEWDERTTKRAEELRRLADEIEEGDGGDDAIEAAVANIRAAAEQAEGLIIGRDSDITYMIIPTTRDLDWELNLIGQLWSLIHGCDHPQRTRIVAWLQARIDEENPRWAGR